MKFSLPRAGAFAPAAILLVTLFGAEASAWAQDLAPVAAVEVAATVEPDAPRFVAEEVVQPLPTEQSLASARQPRRPRCKSWSATCRLPTRSPPTCKCLAQAVYFEARGEPLTGQLAVARVVINRAASGLYPRDYCSVVTQRSQFSFVRNGRIPHADESSPAWLRAKAIAQIAHQDLWKSEAGDALYFHASYVKPGWARRKTQLARIDTHVFYR